MTGSILVLNCGSSSIKFALYPGPVDMPSLKGQIAHIGEAPEVEGLDGAPEGETHAELLSWLLQRITQVYADRIAAVGHRVVHGGTGHAEPVRITADVQAELVRLSPLAPQHQPHNLAGIKAVAAFWPDVPQVACFDTAFHRSQSWEAQAFPLPRALMDAGIQRYGFHGLSYEHIAGVMGEYLPAGARRVITAHLGHGASLCAMLDGKSIATTMGFTALDGLMMATRSGSIDPGVILHLLQEKGMSAKAVSDLLYNQSGLKGVSGISGDMRQLLASDAPDAKQAIDLYTYRIARETGSLMAALGGLDAFIFTGGVGENAAPIRAAVAKRLGWTGASIDDIKNESGGPDISAPGSSITTLVLPTDEEQVIARHTERQT